MHFYNIRMYSAAVSSEIGFYSISILESKQSSAGVKLTGPPCNVFFDMGGSLLKIYTVFILQQIYLNMM